jgi:hypothetical protein
MKLRMIATLAVTAASTWAAASRPADKIVVYLFVNDCPSLTCGLAKRMASQMLAEAGVEVDWRRGPVPKQAAGRPITVRLSTNTPRDYFPGSLAYTHPYGEGNVTVFWDRVREMMEPRSLLAHVMVHEIAHVLQGVSRHSDSGIMKAQWDSRDQSELRFHPFKFTAQDIWLIHRGLQWRASRDSGVAVHDEIAAVNDNILK